MFSFFHFGPASLSSNFGCPPCVFFYILGRSQKLFLQSYVRHCLWLALGNVFGAIRDPQFVAPSAGTGCMQNEPDCTPSLAFISTGPRRGSAKVLNPQTSASTCRLSVMVNHRKCLQLYSSATGLGQAIASPRLILNGGECCPWARWLLKYWAWVSTRNLAADTSALSPEPSTPDFPYPALVNPALPPPKPG